MCVCIYIRDRFCYCFYCNCVHDDIDKLIFRSCFDMMNSEEQSTSCPGFLDEYGIWNNGFECPSLSNQIRVCCGSDSIRYCCTLESFNALEKSFLSSNKTILFYFKKLNQPLIIIFLLIFILFLFLILTILFLCYRSYRRKTYLLKNQDLIKKQTLIIDHFPFSPPHHQIFFNENAQQIKDTLTTSTPSSLTPTRLPSDFYYNDRKEAMNTTQQSIHIHPNHTVQGKYKQNDIIV